MKYIRHQFLILDNIVIPQNHEANHFNYGQYWHQYSGLGSILLTGLSSSGYWYSTTSQFWLYNNTNTDGCILGIYWAPNVMNASISLTGPSSSRYGHQQLFWSGISVYSNILGVFWDYVGIQFKTRIILHVLGYTGMSERAGCW